MKHVRRNAGPVNPKVSRCGTNAVTDVEALADFTYRLLMQVGRLSDMQAHFAQDVILDEGKSAEAKVCDLVQIEAAGPNMAQPMLGADDLLARLQVLCTMADQYEMLVCSTPAGRA